MRAPYRSAQRVTTVARNVLVTVRLENGFLGYGESAPAAYVTGETQATVLAACRTLLPELSGLDIVAALALLAERLTTAPGALAALETALADAAARSAGAPLYQFFGAAPTLSPRAVTDLSLPLLSPEEAARRAARAAADGFHALKIKVGGGDRAADEQRVRAVAQAAPGVRLRLDGNQGFSPEEAVRFAESLSDLAARVDLLEQPTRAGDDAALLWVAQRVPFPLFADESVRHAGDARRLIESGACAGVVLKLAKSGLRGTAEIARAAAAAGGACLFGCMMETRVAIGAALHLALALGPLVSYLDLDGHLLVDDEDLVIGGPRQEGGALVADPQAPGLGLVARPEDML